MNARLQSMVWGMVVAMGLAGCGGAQPPPPLESQSGADTEGPDSGGQSEAGCEHQGERYEPGATRQEDCNQCTCTLEGTWSCTEQGCGAEGGSGDEVGKKGDPCGGMQGLACGEGLYCHYTIEQQCGAADQMGKCDESLPMCTEQYAPVCGCDDKTYSNACRAAAAGVSVAKQGECN